jgi:hypothetical protein
MTTFLFWNLNRKPMATRVAKIAASRDVDVVILAESLIKPAEMFVELRKATTRKFALPFTQCEKIAIYTRFPERFLKVEAEADRFTIRKLSLPGLEEILLAAAHLPSKLHWGSESQIYECERLADEIRRVEKEAGHTRTVLVGDFNVNPFETGMIGARGIHGVMARSIAAQQQRTVQGMSYPFFYNPMWGRMGDESLGPPGTYYANRAEHVSLFWNTFDQVLIRPALLPQFRNEDLEVMTNDGEATLISSNGVPDDNSGSDHLPILFKLTT